MTRNTRIDVARGMLVLYIISVVHGVYWLELVAGPEKSALLFEMPCMFFIAGYSYALSLQRRAPIATVAEYLSYCTQRAGRLLIPYWIYALACLGVLLSVGDTRLFGTPALAWQTVFAWLNPLVYGRAHSIGVLNSHLWFILPFLGVSFVLPLLARVGWWYRFPVWLWLTVCACAIGLVAHAVSSSLARNLLTYSVWAMLGYAAAVRSIAPYVARQRCLIALTVSIPGLALIGLLNRSTLDMQLNKFPPNATFFIFGIAWLSLLYLALAFLPDTVAERIARFTWFRPFMTSGYSIYMWQGMAYTIAMFLGRQCALAQPLVWLLAIVLSVGFGMAASPLESLRLHRPRPKRLAEAQAAQEKK